MHTYYEVDFNGQPYCCSDLFVVSESEYVLLMNNFKYLRYFSLFLLTTLFTFCCLSICSKIQHSNNIIKYKVIENDLENITPSVRVKV